MNYERPGILLLHNAIAKGSCAGGNAADTGGCQQGIGATGGYCEQGTNTTFCTTGATNNSPGFVCNPVGAGNINLCTDGSGVAGGCLSGGQNIGASCNTGDAG